MEKNRIYIVFSVLYGTCEHCFIYTQERYSSFESGIGKKITDGQTSFEELEVVIR